MKLESSPMWKKMRPFNEPSPDNVAQPRPLAAWPSSLPSHENSMDFEFTLIVAGDLTDEAIVDALFEAGCDDASIGMVDGVGIMSFLRDDLTFKDAVLSAIAQVESVRGLHVRRVEPDDILTMAEIAERLDRSRESIRLLVAGARGDGTFPHRCHTRELTCDFGDGRRSLSGADTITHDELQQAKITALVNALLEARWVQVHLGDDKLAYEVAEALHMAASGRH